MWRTRTRLSFSSVQSLSRVRLFATPWIEAHQASLSITNSRSLLKLMPIKSVMPSNHLILCRPLLLLPSIFPSIRVFSNESALHISWPKDWSFNFNISPSNEHSGWISFRMDWLDLLAVQRTFKSLLQQSSLNSLLTVQKHQFFGTQLSPQSDSHIHTWDYLYFTINSHLQYSFKIISWVPLFKKLFMSQCVLCSSTSYCFTLRYKE